MHSDYIIVPYLYIDDDAKGHERVFGLHDNTPAIASFALGGDSRDTKTCVLAIIFSKTLI